MSTLQEIKDRLSAIQVEISGIDVSLRQLDTEREDHRQQWLQWIETSTEDEEQVVESFTEETDRTLQIWEAKVKTKADQERDQQRIIDALERQLETARARMYDIQQGLSDAKKWRDANIEAAKASTRTKIQQKYDDLCKKQDASLRARRTKLLVEEYGLRKQQLKEKLRVQAASTQAAPVLSPIQVKQVSALPIFQELQARQAIAASSRIPRDNATSRPIAAASSEVKVESESDKENRKASPQQTIKAVENGILLTFQERVASSFAPTRKPGPPMSPTGTATSPSLFEPIRYPQPWDTTLEPWGTIDFVKPRGKK